MNSTNPVAHSVGQNIHLIQRVTETTTRYNYSFFKEKLKIMTFTSYNIIFINKSLLIHDLYVGFSLESRFWLTILRWPNGCDAKNSQKELKWIENTDSFIMH